PRDAVVARIREENEHFRARLKSDEARNAFAAFLSRKKAG
ncbi:MAG TPA: enoyl-CoA hydratase, partial [Xanthobacteraceae bacterium]|nr:enoyl-CoA hydratase [Xanthobacteraceae bacterium]